MDTEHLNALAQDLQNWLDGVEDDNLRETLAMGVEEAFTTLSILIEQNGE
jgi:hypothetical protein